MATLLNLKVEIEEKRGSHMKLVFAGASEAHLLARQIGKISAPEELLRCLLTCMLASFGEGGSHSDGSSP